jgi:hypothetical protein
VRRVLQAKVGSLLTSIRYKELHAPHSGDPSRLSDARDSSHVTVADDDVDSYRGESEAVFAAGRFKTLNPDTTHHQPQHHIVTIITHARVSQL